MMMMVVMMRWTSGARSPCIRHAIVLPRARQKPVRRRCVRVRAGRVVPRMRHRRTLTRLLLRMVVW